MHRLTLHWADNGSQLRATTPRRWSTSWRWCGDEVVDDAFAKAEQRLGQGWDQPLATWRERLSIAAIVARSPFAASFATG